MKSSSTGIWAHIRVAGAVAVFDPTNRFVERSSSHVQAYVWLTPRLAAPVKIMHWIRRGSTQ